MTRLIMAFTAILGVLALTAQAATVLSYDLKSSDGTAISSDIAGLSAFSPSAGPGLKTSGKNGLKVKGFETSSADAALAAGDYVAFGFSSEQAVRLETLTLAVKLDKKGPQKMALDVELEGVLHRLMAEGFDSTAKDTVLVFDLSSIGSARNVTMRLLGWDAGHKNGKFEITAVDGAIALTGGAVPRFGLSLPPIPLPPAGILLVAGLGALALRRRRS